jgi:SAM-dependent methyltransferase
MGKSEQRGLQRIYERAKDPKDLPWYRPQPPEMLQRVVEERGARRGRALDLGCGTGAYSLYLAQRGYDVTGIDYLPEPIRIAQENTSRQELPMRFVQADVLTWESDGKFDLVLDSGCLHTLHPSERPAYRQKLVSWLNRAADYVLIHFGKRHLLDWRPMGPRRRARAQVVEELQPELLLRIYSEDIHLTPFPIGPKVLIGSYWFRRA